IDEDVHLMDAMAVVYASGHVSWIPTLHLRSPCSVNLRYFPFDEQKCSIKFASYVYHGDDLNITYFGGSPEIAFDVSDYSSNTNWIMQDHSATIHVIKHACCHEPYPNMHFDLMFKRNPDYYVQTYVLPALLLGGLVPVSLLMPPESRERVTIGSAVVLAMIFLATSLSDVIPMAHTQLPTLCIYYTLTLLWGVMSLMGSALVLNLHNRGPRRAKVPEIVRWIFLRSLKRLVCLGNDSYYPLNDLDTISMRGLDKTMASQERQQTNSDIRGMNSSKVERDIEEICRNMNLLSAKIALQDSRQDVLNEWHQVALVVDRVLFFLFFLVFLMCSVILLA
ncbi:nicotinic acetylcholine receptor subunit type H, partial [Biomphalaria pfeifferi]